MTRRLDMRKEFAACVKRIHGVVLDEELSNPTFENADYWFPSFGVIAELKSLEDDLSSDVRFTNKLSTLYRSWVNDGLVQPPTSPRTRVSLDNLPLQCARQVLGLLKRKLETNCVGKANRQIRATKEHLGAPRAKGHLLLLNDGNAMLNPSTLSYLLGRILRSEHRSINSVTLFSVNELVNAPNVPTAANFWIDAVVPGREPAPQGFRQALYEAWQCHYSLLEPGPILEYQLAAEQGVIDHLSFVKSIGT